MISSSIQTLLPVLLVMVLSAQPAAACAICYGEPDSPMTRGLTWAIVALCAVVGAVLSGVAAFFVHVRRRSATISPGENQGADCRSGH